MSSQEHLKMGEIRRVETSVGNYQPIIRKIHE